jgi:hypothetical protein
MPDRENNPIDVIEKLVADRNWSFKRSSEDEVNLLVGGEQGDYQLSFTWMPDIEALHLACAFEQKIPKHRQANIWELASLINGQLWIGHFDVWFEDNFVMYRSALLLTNGAEASPEQCESMLGLALDACEQQYTAFQQVAAGMSAEDAYQAANFETQGNA